MYHCAQLLPVWPGWGRVGLCGRSQTWWVGVWGILMGCTAFMPNQIHVFTTANRDWLSLLVGLRDVSDI